MVKEVGEDDSLTISSKKSKDKEEQEKAFDYLGIDSNELEDAAFVNFKVDTEVSKKVTKLTHLAISFRMTLEGKSFDEEKGGYRQTGKAIAGHSFISKSNGILMSYASESNLLTQKSMEESFVVQYADACRKVETELLRDRSVGERSTRIIFKTFKDTLWNIGEIITGSKENMAAVFGKMEQDLHKQDDMVNF